jgi:hypothetical protein
MKPGSRAFGVAESYGDRTSTLAGAVVRASRVVDGLVFGQCTVGGTDASDATVDMFERLDRADVQYVLIAGIAPAWYNVLDLAAIEAAVERPVLSVTFEDSEGLERPLREAFEGEALDRRLSTYRSLPPREPLTVNDETLYVRAVGCPESEARDVLRAFTPEGGRPEPLRVARLAARAADDAFG